MRSRRWIQPALLRAVVAWLLQLPAVPQQLTAVARADGELLLSWRLPPGLAPQVLQITVRAGDELIWAAVPDPADREISLPLRGAAATQVELTAVYRQIGRVSRRVVTCTVLSMSHPGGYHDAAAVPPA